MDLDSYIKHKRDGISFQPDSTKKINDLYTSYSYAQANRLNEKSVKESHRLLSKHILDTNWQGKYRIQHMYVSTDDGRIELVAATPPQVPIEMEMLFSDIGLLLKKELSIEQTFYCLAMIHLVFVKIHPWNDGNGRSAKLLEKWFLAEKLGQKSWFIQREK